MIMASRARLDIVCPNNHNQTVVISREEFHAALDSDTLLFHCNTCDTDWPPSKEQIAEIRKQLTEE